MRWWLFVPTALVAAALDMAFMPTLSVGGFTPSLSMILLAFVALHASRASAIGAGLLIGAYMDAQAPAAFRGGLVYVLGPHAIACVIAACAALYLRDVLFRKTVLAVAAAVFALACVESLAFIAIGGLRMAYADPGPLWGAGGGAQVLGADLGDALYSALVALPLAWLLLPTLEAWGFQNAGPKFAN